MTLASASVFVGDDGGAAKLIDTAEQIRTGRQQLDQAAQSTPTVIESEPEEPSLPMLLPAGDLNADPRDPQPGDVFIDALSGRKVQIVAREGSAGPVDPDAQ